MHLVPSKCVTVSWTLPDVLVQIDNDELPGRYMSPGLSHCDLDVVVPEVCNKGRVHMQQSSDAWLMDQLRHFAQGHSHMVSFAFPIDHLS